MLSESVISWTKKQSHFMYKPKIIRLLCDLLVAIFNVKVDDYLDSVR